MAFFSPEKLRPKKIHVDESTATCDSPEIQRRLDRIEQNYQRLDDVLVDIESKLSQDQRLQALDDESVDFELEYGVKPKRKWQQSSLTKTKRRKASAGKPRKPR